MSVMRFDILHFESRRGLDLSVWGYRYGFLKKNKKKLYKQITFNETILTNSTDF